MRILLDIYQQEKEWKKAIEIAGKYEVVTRKPMRSVIAHYHCELGDQAFQKKKHHRAIDYFEKALALDKYCVRANLTLGKVYMADGDYNAAIYILKKVKDQNSDYLSEAVKLIAVCYEKLNQEDELVAYLKTLTADSSSQSVMYVLAEYIAKLKGVKEAAAYVAENVRRVPSLRGLSLFLSLHVSNVQGQVKEDLSILQNLMNKVLMNKPDYQCSSCGFSSKSLHWQCPGCKKWGHVQPIYRLEEEQAA